MANKPLVLFQSNEFKTESSNLMTIDFLSVRIGASLLEIKETAGAFDFSGLALSNVGNVDGVDVSVLKSDYDAHVNGGASKHDATEVDYERLDASKKNILAASDAVEAALSDLDDAIGLLDATPTNYTAANVAIVADHLAGIDAALAAAAGTDILDTLFRISDDGDNTKKIAFQASGIATATTRTITMPDANVNLGHIANLNTLSGVAPGAVDLGTFSGVTIPDASTIKAALQALETDLEAIPSPMSYQGNWNATTNSPALVDGTGVNGYLYNVSVAGTQFTPSISFNVNDKVVYNGAAAKWEKWDVEDAVTSVNGASGAVTVNAINQLTGDVTTSAASGSESKVATIAALAVDNGKIANDTITNAKINASAAIAYSKLNLALSIVNADVAAAAAIARSKFASGTADHVLINNNSGVMSSEAALAALRGGLGADASAYTGLLKFAAGVSSASALVNADVDAAAAIAYSKLALTGAIVNADINASAAIAYSKLNLALSIVNADISASAAIAYSKLNLASSITGSDLAASVAGAGLAGGAGSPLSVNTGDGTKIASDAVVRDDALSFTNDNGSAITVRQAVYIKANGAVDLASNLDSGLGAKMLGLVEDASIASAASGKISARVGALIAGFSGLTPGAPVYLGTAGGNTQTAPTASGTSVYQLGMAISATQILFMPKHIITNV